jgi:hypothetical protein|nr:MAG TPA: hypothetical protein [Caudoviricetes sp.]
MKKVIIPTELVNIIAEEENIRTHTKKAEREIKKQRIAELVAQGIDKAVAKAMTEAFMACGL